MAEWTRRHRRKIALGGGVQQIRDELRFLHRKFDHSMTDVINMFPDGHEDERGTAVHLLGVSRPMLNQYVGGLGATVYSAVIAPETEEPR